MNRGVPGTVDVDIDANGNLFIVVNRDPQSNGVRNQNPTAASPPAQAPRVRV